MQTIRKQCVVVNCTNLARSKGTKSDGSARYGIKCTKHHRQQFSMSNPSKGRTSLVRNLTRTACVRCGWSESYCDLHRIVQGKDGGKYTSENILVLCPNCHRVEHRGYISFINMKNQIYKVIKAVEIDGKTYLPGQIVKLTPEKLAQYKDSIAVAGIVHKIIV